MDYYDEDGGIKIFTALADVIDRRIEQKIQSDNDYDKRFRHELLDEINAKFKTNPYGLDMNMIPVRLRERNKQSAYGWYADECNNIININTDTGMLLTNRTDTYEVTKQRIMKRYAKSCTARSVFTKIINIVEEYKEAEAKKEQEKSKRKNKNKNTISETEISLDNSDHDSYVDSTDETEYYSESYSDGYDEMMASDDYDYTDDII